MFEGRRPPLRLSPVGQELYALTQRMFATSDQIEELLEGEADSAAQPIRIGSDSPIYAARLARALVRARPDAALEVRIDNARETLRGLREAGVDVAIVSDPPMDGQFFYEPLFADRLMVALPADHPMASGRAYPLELLAYEPLMIREPASKTRGAMEMLLGFAEVTPGRVIEVHSREAIREAVAEGLGVSLFFSSECPPDARLAFLPPDPAPERAQLTGYLVCRIERRRTTMMRAALAAAETLKGLSPLPLAPLERGREAPALAGFAAPAIG